VSSVNAVLLHVIALGYALVNGILHVVLLCCIKMRHIPIHNTKLCIRFQQEFVYLVLALSYDSRFPTGDFDLHILASSRASLQWTILNYLFAVSVLFTL
jgi:hypothetical protein